MQKIIKLATLLDLYRKNIVHFGELFKYLQFMKCSDSAFLVATGPSIKQQDLSMLSGHDVFTVSNAFLHPAIKVMNPILHGFASWHEPMDRINFIEWVDHASNCLPERTHILTTIDNRELLSRAKSVNKRTYWFCLYSSLANYCWPHFLKYIFLPPQSGPLLMLPLLMLAGYRRIYLVGCDHTVLRNYGGFISNFYDQAEDIRSHASDPSVWRQDIRKELRCNLRLFDQYEYYQKVCCRLGVNIYNLSDDSWLPFFEYKSFGSILCD